jgi:hypothetical protein
MQELESTDKSTNGTVTLTLEVSDPVVDLGIETRLLDFDMEGSLVTEELAEHIWSEYNIDVEEHGAEIVE